MTKYGTFKYGDGTKYGISATYIKPTILRAVTTKPTMRSVRFG